MNKYLVPHPIYMRNNKGRKMVRKGFTMVEITGWSKARRIAKRYGAQPIRVIEGLNTVHAVPFLEAAINLFKKKLKMVVKIKPQDG